MDRGKDDVMDRGKNHRGKSQMFNTSFYSNVLKLLTVPAGFVFVVLNIHNLVCFIEFKLIRKNLFSLSEKVFKLTYSNVEIKIFSWGNTLDPRFRGGGRGER